MSSFATERLVSRLGLGAAGFSHFYGDADRSESEAVLNHALDRGCTLIDTSDVYGMGHNEQLIGDVIRKRNRDDIFVCTKFGIKTLQPLTFCGTSEYVKQACEASLSRLGMDFIDLYYLHRVDPDTPIEDTVRAMAELVKEGKVRYIGLSETKPDLIRRAHAVHPIAAVQVEYSPWTLDIERNGILTTCNELGIAIVAYCPLGRGIFTGKYKSRDDFGPKDVRRFTPRFEEEAFAENLKLVDALKAVAVAKGCTLSQLTLAWVMAQGPQVIPIPGTKKLDRLTENLGATAVVITKENDAMIRGILEKEKVVGERYPPAVLKSFEK
ncbi:aldo/keto reductase [Chytriomyces sp. MP71]|nr:aldo/keto reductase [Chytriomyces sp. MP71]